MRLGLPLAVLLAAMVPLSANAQGSSTEIAARASKAVVALNHRARGLRGGNPYDNQARSAGFLVSGEGHIVTGLRVVQGSGSFQVVLHGGVQARATLVGIDPLNQIALLQLESSSRLAQRFGGSLPHLSWGSSSKLVRGQTVYTLGNAFDSLILDGTPSFSRGVVTGVERVRGGEYRGVAIETDAAVNPGSFGGPLLDGAGRVVGVVCPAFSARRWLGKAVPGEQVQRSVQALLSKKKPARGKLGVRLQASGGEAQPQGLQVVEVLPGSSAATAGIRVGDLLRAIDGVRIYDTADAARELQYLPPGSPVSLQVSSGGAQRTVTAILDRGAEIDVGELPKATAQRPPRPTRPQRLRQRPVLGVRLEERDGGKLGLKITEVTAGSKAAKAGMKVGDIIMAVDRQRLGTLDDLRAALGRELRRPSMRFVVLRKRNLLTMSIPLELVGAPKPTPRPTPQPRPKADAGYLGVFLTPDAAGPGARVDGAEKGSPAERAGLKEGDVIMAVGGQRLGNTQALIEVLRGKRVGEKLSLTVQRSGWMGKVDVVLGRRGETAPQPPARPTPQPRPTPQAGWLGVALEEAGGRVVVTEVAPNGPCAKAGLQAGDKILSVDGQRVLTLEAVGNWLRGKRAGQTARLHVERNGWTKFLTIKLAKRP